MNNQQYTIEIYEPYEYQGPNPLNVEGVAVLPGPMRTNYYLLELVVPFMHEMIQVRQLLVAPRYSGDLIDRAVSSACTVNISCVLSGKRLDPDDTLWNFDNVHRWGVGKITPTMVTH